jgi:rod shape-determining protein MreC
MTSRDHSNHTLPTFITLVVVAVLLMTFDVRSAGEGVVGTMRGGVQTLLAPLQRGANVVMDPVADFLEGLSDITSLRETNEALRAELARAQAAQAEVADDLARLEALEALHDLDLNTTEVGETPANVIGRADQFDLAFQIDKGVSDGVIEGQPVVDVNGFVVGRVAEASPNTAIVLPVMASRNAVTVLVGSQTGLLTANPGSAVMTLEIFDARGPVREGDQVVTAANTFPAGLAVGEVLETASPRSTALTTTVSPFVDVESLRVVVVLAWPPDPTSAFTTTTTVPAATNTTAPGDTIPEETSTTGSGG